MSDPRIDPELLPLLAIVPPFEFTLAKLPEIRRVQNETFTKLGTPTPAVMAEELHIPADGHEKGLRILSYRPTAVKNPPVYLHLHGGGYVLGTPDMSDARNRMIAERIGCAIYSVDYRLAPETPFPGALHDNLAALEWLIAHAGDQGVDASRIVIGGESAGGGHAAALAILARDKGIPIAGQLLIYPMLDDRTALKHPRNDPARPFHIWSAEDNVFGWECYLGSAPGQADIPALAAPARLEDFAELPPAWIGVGALDLFCDENIEYARRLIAADVAVELNVFPGGFHGFALYPPASAAQRFEAMYLSALKRFFER